MPAKRVLSFQPKSILLPRFDTLGDLVLLEGFIEVLQSAFPQAKITLFIRRPFADLAGLFPETIDWLVTDIDPHNQPPTGALCRNLLGSLGEGEWDLLLATAYNRTWAEDLLAAKLVGSATSLALGCWTPQPQNYRELLAQLGLSTDCPYEHIVPVDELSQEVQKYQTFWQSLAGDSAPNEPKLYISEDLGEIARRILSGLGLKEKNFCLVFPAGTRRISIKAWPAERFADILAWLERQYGLPALVAAHVSEGSKVQEVATLALEKGAHPKTWLGRDGEIPILAAILAAAKMYVGNDTGPMHMAAAVKTPVVAVFGGGHWPRFLPIGNTSVAVAGEMPCFGCGWDCIFEDAPCIRLPAVDDVKEVIQDILENSALKKEAGARSASKKLSAETRRYIDKAVKHLRNREVEVKKINSDRATRLDLINTLGGRLQEVETDRAARLVTIEKLSRNLSEVEADRTARLQLIGQLESRLQEVEADRAARLVTIEKLSRDLSEVEADRAARLETIQQLSGQIAAIESDRAARMETIEKLSRNLSEVEADRTARLHVIEELDKELNQTKHELIHTGENLEKTQRELARIRGTLSVRVLSKLRLIPS